MTNPIDMHKRSRVMQDAVCTLVPALRRYVFQYLVLFEVVELGWITRQWRPLAIDYAKNAVHIAIARYCDSKHSPTLGLRLLERHARSLRYLMLSHSAMCTPDDLGMLARIIRQNTATLRFVSAPNLETYLAACACPLLEDYCPERNGLSSTAFNKHTLYVTTVFCRNIQTLALHENQSDKLTVDTINDILSSETLLPLKELFLTVNVGTSYLKCVGRYGDTLHHLSITLESTTTYMREWRTMLATLARVFEDLKKLETLWIELPAIEALGDDAKLQAGGPEQNVATVPLVWKLPGLCVLSLKHVWDLGSVVFAAPKLTSLTTAHCAAKVILSALRSGHALINLDRTGRPQFDTSDLELQKITVTDAVSNVKRAMLYDVTLGHVGVKAIADHWHHIRIFRCYIQEADRITQLAICTLLQKAPELRSCVIRLRVIDAKCDAATDNPLPVSFSPFSTSSSSCSCSSVAASIDLLPHPNRTTRIIVSQHPCHQTSETAIVTERCVPVRPHLVKFQAPVPFELFARTIIAPHLTFLNCCAPRFLDTVFRAAMPRLRVLEFPCSPHNHRERKTYFSISRTRPSSCSCTSSVNILTLKDGEMSLASTLSWCPQLMKLILHNTSEFAFWTLLNCGQLVPQLQILAVNGTYAWADVEPLFTRLVRAFPHLHMFAYGNPTGITDGDRTLMIATLSALVPHPFMFTANLED